MTQNRRNPDIRAFLLLLAIVFPAWQAMAQVKKPVKTGDTRTVTKTQPASRITDKEMIDSLNSRIAGLEQQVGALESSLQKEQTVSAELRDEMIKLDDYRKKLEQNVATFKGENLHLNQSNRILIFFNAMVAVLLLVTLVFFLRRLGRKGIGHNHTIAKPVNSASPPPAQNFEDKIALLERLGRLREKGLLSEEEFLVEKNRVFGKP